MSYTSATPKQYTFARNIRYVVIVISLVFFVFGAGAVFTGYKPNTNNYITLGIIIVNFVNALINKPLPPNEQTTGEAPETKQN